MASKKTSRNFRGQRVLVVGLGLHGGGAATVRWLVRQGARVTVTDRQTKTQLASTIATVRRLPVTWRLGGHHRSDFLRADSIIVNPAVHPNLPELLAAKRRGIPIANEASLFVQHFPGTLIGVTGTRGKTTTTLLLGAVLKRAHRNTIISGNVREVAMLDHLDRTTSTTWAVLELSSYQLEQLPVRGRSFRVAVMTNLKRDHINRHGSVQAYGQTKLNLFRGQTIADTAVLQWSDPWCRRAASVTSARIAWFGKQLPRRRDGVTVHGKYVVEQRKGKRTQLFPINLWPLPGEHNLLNLVAAVAAARAMGVDATTIRKVIATFPGVPHRQEVIRTWHGHQFINDTTATSPDGTLAALSVAPHGCYIIGGTDKDLAFQELAQALARHQVPCIFLPGTATEKLILALRRTTWRPAIIRAHSMRGAVAAAIRLAKPGQPIVLSPGAASFGLFRHEFERGEQFREVVQALA